MRRNRIYDSENRNIAPFSSFLFHATPIPLVAGRGRHVSQWGTNASRSVVQAERRWAIPSRCLQPWKRLRHGQQRGFRRVGAGVCQEWLGFLWTVPEGPRAKFFGGEIYWR